MKRPSLTLLSGLLSGLTLLASPAAEDDGHWALVDSARSHLLDEAVATGTRRSASERSIPASVCTIGSATLDAYQRPSILPTLSEEVPGLFVTQRGVMGYGVSTGAAGGISVRGLNSGSGQVLVLIDGQPQYQGIFGHSIADSYQTLMAERVEVVRGPASMLYGSNAMGGVVNIITHQNPGDGVRTRLRAGGGMHGTFMAEASNRVRKGDFFSIVAAQYSRSDNHRPHMGFQQYGGQAKIGLDLGSHWTIAAQLNLTHFGADNPGSLSSPLKEAHQEITRGAASLMVENRYDRSSGRVSVYDNFGRHKINDGYGPSYNANKPQDRLFRSRDALAGVSFYENVELFSGNHTTFGFDYQHIYGHAWYTSRSTGKEVPGGLAALDRSVNEYAGYVDFGQDIVDWLTVDGGVRYDHHSVVGGEWVPQAGLVIRPFDAAEFKGTAAKGFRNPTPKDLYLYKAANTELDPERMWNFEAAWRHKIAKGHFVYGLNFYHLRASNIIQTVNGSNQNTGTVRNTGLELDATALFGEHWRLTTNHSWVLHMKQPMLYTPRYKGYIGLGLDYEHWAANVGVQRVSKLYKATSPKAPTETFTLLSASLTYKPLDYLQVWAKGENLLAQRYEILSGLPMPRATMMAGVTFDF